MRRVVTRTVCVLATAAAMVSAPDTARAEGFVNPWAGVVFGNHEAERKFGSFGVAIGALGRIAGLEVNIGHAPDFFDETVENSETDVTGNLVVGPMMGSRGHGVRPYVVGGLGIIRTRFGGLATTSDLGFDLGAGVSVYFTPHIGFRGDARYFRTINADDPFRAAGAFHFWRAQLGITIH